MEDDLDAAHAVVGLLATIPILCMGLCAPLATRLARRVGIRSGMAVALGLIGCFGVVRAVVPGAWLVVLLTLPVGIGMGLGNALAPLAVKEQIPDRPATATGVYTTGMQIGSAVSAAVAVPLAAALGGWRFALATFSLVACGLLLAWGWLTRGRPSHVPPQTPMPRLPWRSRTAWLLVAIFALMGSSYYGLNAWLADAYGERGWSDAEGGALIAMMHLTAIPASFLIPWLSERSGGRRPYLVAMSLVFLVGGFGLVALPGLAYGWALVTGIAQGAMFALVMTLPLDLEERGDRVGGLVGLMLGLGYTLSATSPFLLGAVRDASDSFDAVLWVIVGLLAVLVTAVLALPGSRRSPRPNEPIAV
jgi:MFS transporter, CP family, cyanate transporter